MNKTIILKYLTTLYYLKPRQIFWRLYYYLRKKNPFISPRGIYKITSRQRAEIKLKTNSIPSLSLFTADNSVTILNSSTQFDKKIDWKYDEFGMLWCYNLTFFDFLLNPNMDIGNGIRLIHDFIDNANIEGAGYDSHPISVRVINWIKFILIHNVNDKKIDNSLSTQLNILSNNIEYHLLGNHLLENGFGLYYGANYFNDKKLLSKAEKILNKELDEQFLSDGAHFELTPMYHQIMLFRLLDCLNLYNDSEFVSSSLIEKMTNKAKGALSWINAVTFSNGDIPMVNDSTFDIAPSTKELNEFAKRLSITPELSPLYESGYRMIRSKKYELFVDVAAIGPDYIPGHAHADTLNFILYIDGKPFIIDRGISTYEKNRCRTLERGTASHNTIQIDNLNSSDVWGGFRVAARAKIIDLKEDNETIQVTHNGYIKLGIFHTRKFSFKENEVIIKDRLSQKSSAMARLHFHPSVNEDMIYKYIMINDQQLQKSQLSNYDYALGFNKTKQALMLEIPIDSELITKIKLS